MDADPYVEMCVEAACSCPSVGDCACFCDVIAAYAQACSERGVSVSWRSNNLCRECKPFLYGALKKFQLALDTVFPVAERDLCSLFISVFFVLSHELRRAESKKSSWRGGALPVAV